MERKASGKERTGIAELVEMAHVGRDPKGHVVPGHPMNSLILCNKSINHESRVLRL